MKVPVVILVLGLLALPAAAASDAALDSLFAELQRNPADDAAAALTEQKIWSAWMQAGTAAENQRLAEATGAMNAGSFAAALGQLNALLDHDKGNPEIWNKRATLYFLMGRLDESLADIVRTLDLEPRHFGALSGRGMILMQQHRFREALDAYRDAAAINPHMPGVKAAIKLLEARMPEL